METLLSPQNNKKNFIKHIKKYVHKNHFKATYFITSLPSSISKLCILLGVSDDDFYSWDEAKLKRTYNDLMRDLFRAPIGSTEAYMRYAYRWYFEAMNINHDPLRRKSRRNLRSNKDRTQVVQLKNTQEVDVSPHTEKDMKFTPVVLKGADGCLYLKLN